MTWEFTIEKIAGIRSGEAIVQPGVNAVRGSNWQGKSSFLTAIRTVMGTTAVPTEGTNGGSVQLKTAENTYRVEVAREDGTVVTNGNPYLSDEKMQAIAEQFAFLGEDNDLREAVRNDRNLEEHLLKPLDFENIDERIASLKNEREQVERELEWAKEAVRQLPEVEKSVENLESEIESLKSKRATLSSNRLEGEQVTERREELSNAIAKRENTTDQIERLSKAVKRIESKLDSCRTELEDLGVPDVEEGLEAQLSEAREQYERAERDAELLQSVYAPTKRLLDENRVELITDIDHGLDADSVICWTCGSKTNQDEIERQIEALRERVTELRKKARDYKSQMDELEQQREKRQQVERKRRDLEEEIKDLSVKLEDRESSLETARSRLDDLDERIEELSQEVEVEDNELTDVESEIKYKRARLEDARDEQEKYSKRADQCEMLQSEYDNISREIITLRTRKDDMKQRTREAFDEAMQDILERFETGFESARLTSTFDLMVAREGREANLRALSEGETELLGLVAALAGFDAFESSDVPIMLVDSLNSLADENFQTLVEYLSERVEYLVVTAYPDHSSFETNTINPEFWEVVSPQSA